MGRNRPANTAHIPLRTTFQRKGGIGMGEKKDIRSMIIHKQIEHKEHYGYIYEITYDSPPFYHIFKENYYVTDDGGSGVNYPGDDAFRDNDHQWAWCTMNLEEAYEILNSFECNL
jgi:hypothetical protein